VGFGHLAALSGLGQGKAHVTGPDVIAQVGRFWKAGVADGAPEGLHVEVEGSDVHSQLEARRKGSAAFLTVKRLVHLVDRPDMGEQSGAVVE